MESQEQIIEQTEQLPSENVIESPNDTKETLSLRDALEKTFNETNEAKPEIEQPEADPEQQKDTKSETDTIADDGDFKLIPKEWNEKERSSFESLKDNPETKEAYNVLIDRYENMRRDYHKKNQERSELAKKVDMWDNAIDQEAKESLKRNGIEPHEYFNRLLNVEKSLISDPANTIKNLMSMYNVDPKLIVGQDMQEDNNDDYLDYDQELSKVKKELQELKESEQRKLEQSKRTSEEVTQKTIQDFKYATGEDGELKYPLFDEVRDEMGLLLNKGKAKTLEEAYNNSPTVLLKQKEIELQKKVENDLEQERLRVAKAKKASTGLSKTISASNPQLRSGNLRSIIAENLLGQ